MPVYSFEHSQTGEEFELTMSYDELQQFLTDHPEVNQTFRMNIVDPMGIGVSKPPSDFMKNVIGRIKSSAPGASQSALEKRWNIPREW